MSIALASAPILSHCQGAHGSPPLPVLRSPPLYVHAALERGPAEVAYLEHCLYGTLPLLLTFFAPIAASLRCPREVVTYLSLMPLLMPPRGNEACGAMNTNALASAVPTSTLHQCVAVGTNALAARRCPRFRPTISEVSNALLQVTVLITYVQFHNQLANYKPPRTPTASTAIAAPPCELRCSTVLPRVSRTPAALRPQIRRASWQNRLCRLNCLDKRAFVAAAGSLVATCARSCHTTHPQHSAMLATWAAGKPRNRQAP